MLWLILGLALWAYSHGMKRVTPGLRARLGDPGKGLAAVLALGGIVLMVIGYRQAAFIGVYTPPPGLRHLNSLLMLIAVYLLFLGYSRGVMRTRLRHPMLNAVKTWAIAHLLVRGDLASIILFGGLFAWALADMIMINRMQPAWKRPEPGPVLNDVYYGLVALVAFVAIVFIHGWLGPAPFGWT